MSTPTAPPCSQDRVSQFLLAKLHPRALGPQRCLPTLPVLSTRAGMTEVSVAWKLGRSQKSCKADENPQQASLLECNSAAQLLCSYQAPRLKVDMSPECGLRRWPCARCPAHEVHAMPGDAGSFTCSANSICLSWLTEFNRGPRAQDSQPLDTQHSWRKHKATAIQPRAGLRAPSNAAERASCVCIPLRLRRQEARRGGACSPSLAQGTRRSPLLTSLNPCSCLSPWEPPGRDALWRKPVNNSLTGLLLPKTEQVESL